MKKKQKKIKKKNKIKKKKPINKKFKRINKFKKKFKTKSKKKNKQKKFKKAKIIRNQLYTQKAKQDSITLKLVKLQLSLKPEFNFKFSFCVLHHFRKRD